MAAVSRSLLTQAWRACAASSRVANSGAARGPALAAAGHAHPHHGQQRRHLSLHEADSLELMKGMGVTTAKCLVAHSPAEAFDAVQSIGGTGWAVKAQVLAGGRGKGHFDNGFEGGVHLVDSAGKAREVAEQMIGHQLITKQTGDAGRPCNKVLVVEKMDIIKEYYFAILMDRSAQGPVIIASSQGGMDIEAVAASNPEDIVTVPIDVKTGLDKETALGLAEQLGFSPQSANQAAAEMLKLYDMFIKYDCGLLEINPMVQDAFGTVMCLDAKVSLDENAEFRQPDAFALRDQTQENAKDVMASKADLNYIELDGNIGCLVNGAGLAMATMDIIQLYGGSPANFLDVGGGATAGQVKTAFDIITQDPKVSVILVNIFGGIMRCDVIAEGIISATRELDLKIPVVVRLQGTMKMEAKALIATSNLDIITADELGVAARKAVEVSKIVELARAAGMLVRFQDEVKAAPVPSGSITPTFT